MKRFTILLFVLSLTSGCGSQLQPLRDGTNSSSGAGTIPTILSWDDVHLDSKVVGGVYDKQQTIGFDKETKMIRLRLPISGGAFLGSAASLGAIPGVNNSEIKVEVDDDGSTAVSIEVPLSSLLAGLSTQNQTETLPNGNALPHLPAGKLSYTDIEVGAATTARIFFGKGLFGLFIETPFNPFIEVTFPSKNQAGDVLGYLTQVAAHGSFSGGYFMGIVLPENLQRSIQNLF